MRSGRTGQPFNPDAIPPGGRATLGHLAFAGRENGLGGQVSLIAPRTNEPVSAAYLTVTDRSSRPSPAARLCSLEPSDSGVVRVLAGGREGCDHVADRGPAGHLRGECFDVMASQQQSARHWGGTGPDVLRVGEPP